MSTNNPQSRATTLTIDHLRIERLDGISGPFSIDQFVSGVNLIVGPNASGKSRTAESLQSLIWPSIGAATSIVSGLLRTGDAHWDVRNEGKVARYLRDGRPTTAPVLEHTPPTHRDRYLLTLQDLLHAANQPFADQIQRESAGGYDLPKARVDAGVPKSSPKPKGNAEVKELQATTSKHRAIRSVDDQLRRQEQSLENLKLEIAGILDARTMLTHIDRALEHADISAELQDLEAQLGTFAESVERMHGDEFDRIRAIQANVESTKQEDNRFSFEVDSATGDLAQTGFLDAIPETTLVPTLRGRIQQLSQLVVELRGLRESTANQQSVLVRVASRLQNSLTPEQLDLLDGKVMRDLAGHMIEAMRTKGVADAQNELADWIGEIQRPTNLSELATGVDLLSERLRLVGKDQAAVPPTPVRIALLFAATVIVVLAVLFAADSSPHYGVLSLLAIPVGWIAFRKIPPADGERALEIQRDYNLAGLPDIPEWTPVLISQVLAQVRTRLAEAEVERVKADKWEGLSQRRQQLADQMKTTEERRDHIRNDLGIELDDTDWESLRMLAKDLEEWRSVNQQLIKAADLIDSLKTRFDDQLNLINTRFAEVSCPVVADDIEALAMVESLQTRMEQAQHAERRKRDAEREIERRIVPEIERLKHSISEIYESLGVADGDVHALKLLCDQKPAHAELVTKQLGAQQRQAGARKHLETESHLIDLGRSDLESMRMVQDQFASQYEGKLREQTGIETKIIQAKLQHQIEDAALAEATALENLGAALEQSHQQKTAWLVSEFVAARTRDLNRPQVYRTANDLFTAFTSGRFSLEFEDGPPAVFQARDRTSDDVLTLEQLSSGTRVQLLMAVRLAFIETRETGYALPLILDETFANTDDQRMLSIMDATIEIARRGRQIFYLTAQHDEVARWTARLDIDRSVPYITIDLAAIRGQAAYLEPRNAIIDSIAYSRVVPEAIVDRESAREFLQVGPIDPWKDGLGHASLWYFLTDVPMLLKAWEFDLLTWGQFEVRGRQLLSSSSTSFDEQASLAVNRHRTIEVALKHWREGRAAPITRHELETHRFFAGSTMDAVCSVAESEAWDGIATLERLRTAKTPGVTAGRLTKLEEWLESEGKLASRLTLTPFELRGHVFAAMQGQLTEHEVDDILRCVQLDR